MIKPKKEYILWVSSDGGFTPTEFDTLEEALTETKYTSDWYVTRAINDITAYSSFRAEKKEDSLKDPQG